MKEKCYYVELRFKCNFRSILFRNTIDTTAPALPKVKKKTKIRARTNLFNVFIFIAQLNLII